MRGLPAGLDEGLFKMVEGHLRLEVLADIVRAVRFVGQRESFDVAFQKVLGREVFVDQNVVMFAFPRFKHRVGILFHSLLDFGPDFLVVTDVVADRLQRDANLDLGPANVDVADAAADEDALAFVDDFRARNNTGLCKMPENVQKSSTIQGIEMKGLDRAVVGKQVERGQKEEQTPSPVEIPGEEREDREVDEEGSQVDLRKKTELENHGSKFINSGEH